MTINSTHPTLEVPQIRRGKVASFITNNWPQKMIALVCSIALFILVIGDKNRNMTFTDVPVSIRVPDGYALVGGDTTKKVNIKVLGRTSKLKQIKREDLDALTVTPHPKAGNTWVTFRDEMLNLPEGVNVESFQPSAISIDLEPMARRFVPITTEQAFTGELAQGFERGEVRLNPVEIEIAGAESLVDDVTKLTIEPIDLTGKASSFSVLRWAVIPKAGIKATTSTRVEVFVNVVSKAKHHVFLGVPIVPLNLSKTHEIVPETVDLTLIGDEEALAKIDSSRLFIAVEAAKDEAQSTHSRLIQSNELQVPNLPSGVVIDESKLPSVLLTVSDSTNDAK